MNLPREAVDVEILQPGSRGILGLGAEDAVVRLTPRPTAAEPTAPPPEAPAEAPAAETPAAEGDESDDRFNPTVRQRATEILQTLLQKMGVQADINLRIGDDLVEPDETPPLTLDITGPDLGLLIGRRGETLESLQFVLRQILNKEMGRWVPVVVDVESYRVRRRKSLKQLADRMADRVAFSRKKIVLEPMPAQERRIIHLQLRNHEHVYTHSVGEGDQRKVVIFPK